MTVIAKDPINYMGDIFYKICERGMSEYFEVTGERAHLAIHQEEYVPSSSEENTFLLATSVTPGLYQRVDAANIGEALAIVSWLDDLNTGEVIFEITIDEKLPPLS